MVSPWLVINKLLVLPEIEFVVLPNINSVFVGILTNDSVFKIIFVFGVLL